jgi:4-amino-4-deoxy-L-arabinose transferase-like glycosyltransferase
VLAFRGEFVLADYQPQTMFGLSGKASHRVILATLLVTAFLIRLGVRLTFGEDYFWTNSYSDYYDMAENVLSGNGFCLSENVCAWRPPLYPLFLSLSILAGKNWLLVVIPQALMGAGTALCAFLIGRQIFNPTVGVIACAITALYPYYIMHDTALQETAMVTFCTTLSVWLLLRASVLDRNLDWFLSGLALGSLVLVRTSAVPIAGIGLFWTAIWGAQGKAWERLRKSSFLLLAVIVTVCPWLFWTYHVTGKPVLSSEVGHALWMGNNPETFSHYPAESIDRSTDEAWSKMTQSERDELARLAADEIATSNWFAQHAWAFIRANPRLVVIGAIRKLEAGFSPQLNPVRDPLTETAYAIGYVPIAVLGVWGMYLARLKSELFLIAMIFLSFICVTAVFWAHTSHRSYLDVFLIIFTAFVVENCGLRIFKMWPDTALARDRRQ